jgi:hypothetical protein
MTSMNGRRGVAYEGRVDDLRQNGADRRRPDTGDRALMPARSSRVEISRSRKFIALLFR